MADFAVHLNQATQTCGRPSVFDLMAQESLMSSLRPAFEFTTRTLYSHFPEKLSRLVTNSDEIFYAIVALIERHFLWTKGASFSEHFYGLKRISLSMFTASDNKHDGQLNFSQKTFSLLSLTVLPYLAAKLEKQYTIAKENELACERTPSDKKANLNDFIHKLFPYLHSMVEGSKLLTIVLYVTKLINFNSATNGIMGLTLAYSNFQDNDLNVENITLSPNPGRVMSIISKTLKLVSTMVSLSLEYALPTAVFFLRFVEWWYASSSSPHNQGSSLPLPPAPVESKIAAKGVGLPTHQSQCPLCGNIHKNPTALSVSGYVFCYSCIFKFVDANRTCPVTHYDCDLDDLVRLYF